MFPEKRRDVEWRFVMEHTSNIDAIYREFPFLEVHASRSAIQEAKVSRWSNDDINTRYPHEYRGKDNRTIRKNLFLIDKKGNIVCTVGKLRPVVFGSRKKCGCFASGTQHELETIGQALARLTVEEKKRISFGLEMEVELQKPLFFVRWVVSTDVLKIIKLPKGSDNALEWLESVVNESIGAIQDL